MGSVAYKLTQISTFDLSPVSSTKVILCTHLADISNWLFGIGYLFGTHSGVTFQIGYDINGLY